MCISRLHEVSCQGVGRILEYITICLAHMCPVVYLISCPVPCCVPSPPLAFVHTHIYRLCDLYTYIYRDTLYTNGRTLRNKIYKSAIHLVLHPRDVLHYIRIVPVLVVTWYNVLTISTPTYITSYYCTVLHSLANWHAASLSCSCMHDPSPRAPPSTSLPSCRRAHASVCSS